MPFRLRSNRGGQAVHMALSNIDRRTLLQIARASIAAEVAEEPRPPVTPGEGELARKAGVFVSLHERATGIATAPGIAPGTARGALRGCIGTFASQWPLPLTVQEMACAAAMRDPRFPRVTPDEVPHITIEISVLSEPQPIERIDDIEVGVHGLYVIRDTRRGVLLPQVAEEHGWDRTTFLENTCLKAGLALNAWRESDTVILVFSAEIFDEESDEPTGSASGDQTGEEATVDGGGDAL